MTINEREIDAMVEEWEELDPYGFRDALLDCCDNDREILWDMVAGNVDAMREMLDELRDETC